MKLTKQLEKDVRQVYLAYWESYFSGNLQRFASLIDADYQLIGTSEIEVLNGKQAALQWLKRSVKEIKGKAEFRNRKIKLSPLNELVIVTELADAYVLVRRVWKFYSSVRVSTLLRQTISGWKVVQQHGSMPDPRTREGETVSFETLSKENLELRDAVKRRTAELENKNQELVVEAALERVRTVAMSMKKSGDLLAVCKAGYRELKKLGFAGLRNMIIHTYVDEQKYFNDYDYSDALGGVTARVPYTGNPVIEKFIKTIRKGKTAFSEIKITGKQLEDWKKFRKSNKEPVDPRLNKATSLYYYIYSVGAGSIGISAFQPIDSGQRNILIRFRNVFDLSYQRYLDIEKAEAQAREAQIEASVERVRSRALAMHKSSEVLEVVKVLNAQLRELQLTTDYTGATIFLEQEDGLIRMWDLTSLDAIQKSFDVVFRKMDAPADLYIMRMWRSRKDYTVTEQNKRDLQVTVNWLKQYDKKTADELGILISKHKLVHGWHPAARLKRGWLCVDLDYSPPEEFGYVLPRMASAFDLAYQRFLDLQKAEAQAREAQIETALEKIRSATMAMQKSDELQKVVHTVFERLKELKVDFYSSIIILFTKGSKDIVWWFENSENQQYAQILIPYANISYLKDLFDAKESGKGFFSKHYPFREKNRLFEYLFDHTGLRNIPGKQKKFLRETEFATISAAIETNTGIHITSYSRKFISEQENEILRRFAKVFEQTYTRFLDLQNAEAQAREAQIEAALERVRAKVMAMNSSKDLPETSLVFGEQLRKLGIDWQFSYFWLIEEDKDDNTFWITWPDNKTSTTVYSLAEADENFRECIIAWKEQVKIHASYVPPEGVKPWLDTFERIKKDAGGAALEIMQPKNFKNGVYYFDAMIRFGSFGILINRQLSEEEMNIQARFATEFERAYTRFLDLQKAEAQTREAQIELGLERVRARAMAMQRSDELAELVDTVFRELTKLDMALTWCMINVIDESSLSNTVWTVNAASGKIPESFHMKFEDYPFHHAMMKGWKERATKYVYVLEGREKKVYDEYLFSETEFRRVPAAAQAASRAMEKYVCSFSFSNFGGLQTVGDAPLSEGSMDILSRFGKVFDLTYTRFNDLKQAEAQAREAEIQLALERVRARTMAMQKSDELPQAANLLFQQVQALGMPAWSAGYCIWDDDKRAITLSMSSEGVLQPSLSMPLTEDPSLIHFLEAHERGETFFVEELGGEELRKHYMYLRTLPGVKETLDDIEKAGFPVPTFQIFHLAYFSKGFLLFITYEPVPEAWDIFKRFAAVFEQTYTRFLDLQKAEAQARESQIQLALERVRARTMAMQRSEELQEAALLLIQQVQSLGIPPFACGFNIWDADRKMATAWMAREHALQPPFKTDSNKDIFLKIFEAAERGDSLFVEEQEGDKLDKHYQYMASIPVFREVMEKMKKEGLSFPSFQIMHCAYFSQGYLMFISYEPVPEAHDIFIRFAKVFEQTYTRFLDLQKAEAQAREAQIEAALERVRGRAMAMHKSEDLNPAVATVFEELEKLCPGMSRCGIGIIDGEKRSANAWITSITDKGSTVQISGEEPLDIHALLRGAYDAWQQQSDFFYVLQGKDMAQYYKTSGMGNVRLPESQLIFSEDELKQQYYYFVSFQSGGLFAFRETDFPEEAKTVMKRFASVFNLTYKRFLDLQKAEAQAREAQIEAALERVRSRSMGMQKSEELKEVIKIVYQQLKHLKIDLDHAGFVVDYTPGGDWHFWIADQQDIPAKITHPWFESVWANQFNKAKDKGDDFFATLLNFEEKNKFYHELLAYVPGLPETSKEFYLNCPGLAASTVLLDNVALYIENFSGIPYTDEENNTLMRFGKVFQQTYTRFLDLQKAEAQTREAQINLAVERVRARALAMYKSEEILELVFKLKQEMMNLDIPNVVAATIHLKEKDGNYTMWDLTAMEADDGKLHQPLVINYRLEEVDPDLFISRMWGNAAPYFLVVQNEEDFKRTFQFLRDHGRIKEAEESEAILKSAGIKFGYHPTISLQNGRMCIDLLEPPSDEIESILTKMGAAFDLAYKRFEDLRNSEAQLREAQIESALERVRSRTMGMQRSNELPEAANLLFQQIESLGIHIFSTGYNIWEEDKKAVTSWMSSKGIIQQPFLLPLTEESSLVECYEAAKRGDTFFVQELSGEKLFSHFTYMSTLPVIGKLMDQMSQTGIALPDHMINHHAFFLQGYLLFISYHPVPEAHDIFKRFAKVFEQTYTRFLDLQKAEAQARESRIEAALERTRTQSMLMQHSEQLDDTLRVFHEQVLLLGIKSAFSFLWLPDEKKDRHIFWAAWAENHSNNQRGENDSTIFNSKAINYPLDRNEPATAQCLVDWKSNQPVHAYHVAPAEVENYFAAWKELLDGVENLQPEHFREGLYYVEAFMKYGCFGVMIEKEMPEEEKRLLHRFAIEFERTYTRFLDLQKAEAQAREAQVELGLERVRARAMAMQKPEELRELIGTVFTELTKLDLALTRCLIMIYDTKTEGSTWWMANSETPADPIGLVVQNHESPPYLAYLKAWKDKKIKWQYLLEGTVKKEWDDFLFVETELSHLPDFVIAGMKAPEQVYLNASFNSFGNLTLATLEPLSDEHFDIMLRFAKVFDLTYTRFLDLQKAEAQAREATIEASLERVRGKAMAMHSSQDLADAISVFYKELQHFSITPRRCGVGLLNKEDRTGELFTWNTTEEGHSLDLVGKITMEGHPVLDNVYEHWIAQTEYHPVLRGKEVPEYYRVIRPQMAFPDYKQDEVQYGYFFFFPEGAVYAWTVTEISEDELAIYRRFTSVLSLTYKRYKDLQQAEALAQQAERDLIMLKEEKKRTEEALAELQVTQKQLIQSEKMASLGELTAGIAHEIQNPLNFVNNFSEVSNELLDEMLEEAAKGNFEEVKEILNDVKQNLEKINHHGKRADGIVKGMLQHSRSSSGQKEPTDINVLADEYLRLAYHGLRAKDKSFNATMKTAYEENLPNVNVIPQDIGRVVLNLITNAFYVVNEKKNSGIDGYEPTVTVTTKKVGDKVELCVKDNGSGIPQRVLEKIFQPFFTTKPTGQGTGLGLSLSYDIVKAHGGELRVETKEGTGSEFVIQLNIV